MIDDATLGGYASAHGCPPTFVGSDGESYSAEPYVDDLPHEDGSFGAAVVFIKWSEDGTRPVGHLETDFLKFGKTTEKALAEVKLLTLHDLRGLLNSLIEHREGISCW